MRRHLLAVLAVFLFAVPVLPQTPPRIISDNPRVSVPAGGAARGRLNPKAENSPLPRGAQEAGGRQAEVYPYFYGIDAYGRWILDILGYMNFVPPRPVEISLNGALAYLVVPQSSMNLNGNPFIKSDDATRFEYALSFERTGKYPIEVDVPDAPWPHPLQGWVLARPHGEIQSQCVTSQQLVRAILVVDWLEIVPQRILHTALFDGVTSVGDAQGFRAYQIKETGIWVAFYELDIPLSEYQQQILMPLYPYQDLTLAADTGDKVIMYDVAWATSPVPCAAAAMTSSSAWEAK